MRINILIGGKAGQGINKISEIVSKVMNDYGYYTFNYRDYPSLIRGGHNFNVLTFSTEPTNSNDSKLDIIIALDENTKKIHSKNLKKEGIILGFLWLSSKSKYTTLNTGSLYFFFNLTTEERFE